MADRKRHYSDVLVHHMRRLNLEWPQMVKCHRVLFVKRGKTRPETTIEQTLDRIQRVEKAVNGSLCAQRCGCKYESKDMVQVTVSNVYL